MINSGNFLFPLCVLIVVSFFPAGTDVYGQSVTVNEQFWSDDTSISQRAVSKSHITANNGRKLSLQFESFTTQVKEIRKAKPGRQPFEGAIIRLPLPDGTFGQYKVAESPIMDDRLAFKYPQIKTYAGQALNNPSTTIRFDITPDGFHAIIFLEDNTVYIDPLYVNNTTKYLAYYKKDFIKQAPLRMGPSDIKLLKDKELHSQKGAARKAAAAKPSGSELRTYRLAVAATGEYTAFHGGTVVDGLSAIVTSMNRVNGIYEREVAISMILVGDNDQIIYTDSGTDPYTNNDTEDLLTENQTNLDNVIGSANYDIGHVFSTASGGLASLESVCDDSFKAQGTTGIATPVGDPFDVDFVAHEIGHQFGATHTFNGTTGNCDNLNRSGITSYEPGSGTTIMAYAGICSPQNIQNNSSDYFHTASYDQIIEFVTNGGGSCANVTATGNTPPSADAGDDYFIPVNTPFVLTGSATDDDGDPLTYCWEQFDLGPASPPNDPNSSGPLFRSFPPLMSPSRTFPQLSDILNNTATVGEILPAITRTMDFRLTVRDNQSGGGGVDYDDMTINVVDLGGQFELSSLNQGETILSGIPINVSWEVANTNTPPINTQQVNIRLSTDGGLTFPILLAENLDNDGLEAITFPDNPTTQARLKIEAVGNIFFDISDENFSIQTPVAPDYAIIVDPLFSEICTPNNAVFTIDITPILGFSNPIDLTVDDLPAGVDATFSENPMQPGTTGTLTLSNTAAAVPGEYVIELVSSSGAINKENDLTLNILSAEPPGPTLSVPNDQDVDIALRPFFSWVDDPQINTYTLELALDADFTNIVDSVFDLNDAFYRESERLESNVSYYWRVKGVNNCGIGQYSEVYSFTTTLVNYFTFESTDVPKTIDSSMPNSITSTLEIEIVDDMIISDVNVINLLGQHSFIGDLKFTLRSPADTEVVLFANICSNEEDFDLSLDDEALNATIACPPSDGKAYQPTGDLSDFDGQNAKGTWTLIVEDNATIDGGTLNGWGLEIGTAQSAPKAPDNLQAAPTSVDIIALSWEDLSNNEDNFVLERSTPDNSNFMEVANLSANTLSFDDENLTPETNYVYRLKAINQFGESAYTQEIETAPLPIAPNNLAATAISEEQIDLSWSDLSSMEEEYVIEQSVGDNENFAIIDVTSANAESYSVTGLEEATTYHYRIYARNLFGRSASSDEASTATLVLGIEDEIAKKISVFPNPTEDEVTIKIQEGGPAITAVHLTDIHGKTVYSRPNSDNARRYQPLTLKLNAYSKGLYLLQIITERATVIKRILKD